MARILISAGEASGDLYAGAVTRGIKQLNPEAEVFGMGGDCLREVGGEVLFDIKDHSLMGFVEVLKKLPDVWKLRNAFIDLMEKRKPDVLLTIDYPGFNMRPGGRVGLPMWQRSRIKLRASFLLNVTSISPTGLI